MAYQKVLRSIAVTAVFSIVISVVLVGAGESRLSAAGLDGNRSADIMEIVGGYGLKLSCFVVVACSIALAFISRTRECLSYALRMALLMGLTLLVMTMLGWGPHSWTMILIFPAFSFAVSAVVFLTAAGGHAFLQ